MTDPTDTPPTPELDELVAEVLEQIEEIAALDAARAEAWASDVLSLAAEAGVAPVALFDALAGVGGDGAATALVALAGLHDGVPCPDPARVVPSWSEAIGTSRCEGAWALRSGGSESIAFRFVDVLDDRHVITVDLLPGAPETVGEVMVGPGDLLDALHEEDARIDSEDGGPAALADRCVAALRATSRPTLSAVVNGRLLLRRLATLVEVDVEPPVSVEDEIPDAPRRDPDDDAYALEILTRALGGSTVAEDLDAAAAVAALVAPVDLAPLGPAERDAVFILEWADWLGAVIGLVRGGEGIVVDGAAMVDLVNRCPEVTTTIPRADRARIAWAFDTAIASWTDLGILDDGRLTGLGVEVLPAALRRAWT
ncbi:MAG: hypothetical protein R2707_20595 [Acidimicrobiales bacterium]